MLSFYQHLPENISPIALSVEFFELRWYSLMYLLGFVVVYLILRYRIHRGEKGILIFNFQFPISNQIQNSNDSNFKHSKLVQNSKLKIQDCLSDWIIYVVAGLLIGGRLGYVLFYNFGYYAHNPWMVVSPYNFSAGTWTGISGMSYFGGALGAVLASWIWTRKNKLNFWGWADFVIPAIPAGYFFGRLGNFWNGELYGRITEKPWGMYFPADFGLALRHPSQLYEAFFEGLILFVVLWFWRNKVKFPGQMPVIYLLGYGFFRFGIEFFREPDPGANLFFGSLTLGQLFALGFMGIALILGSALSKKEKAV